jgi:hypothetical protein
LTKRWTRSRCLTSASACLTSHGSTQPEAERRSNRQAPARRCRSEIACRGLSG